MMKKVLCMMLVLVMMISLVMISVDAAEVDEADNGAEVDSSPTGGLTIQQLRSKFPTGSYFNHALNGANNPDVVTYTPCPSNHDVVDTCTWFGGSSQCMGFAKKVTYDYYGSMFSNWSVSYDINSLKAGDVIHYYPDGTHQHFIWVTKVSGNTITYVDCNGDYHCGIKWDQTTTKSVVQSKSLKHIYVAPKEINDNPAPLTISSVNFSTTIAQGTTANPTGSLSSGSVITWVWAGVTVENGDVVNLGGDIKKAEINPMTTSYNFSDLTKQINLSNLPVGEYYYKIDAISNNKYYTPYRQKFRIVKDEVVLNNPSFSDAVLKGTTANPTGSLSAGFEITWVWAGVTVENGDVVNLSGDIKKAEANPMTTSYDISNLTKQINLSNLPVGEYYYAIHAISNNKYYTLYRQKFSIVENKMILNDFSFTDTIVQGNTTNPTGYLTSDAIITWVWVGVTVENGDVVNLGGDVKKAETNPMKTSYDFSNLTKQINLSNLPVGEYYYLIHAISNNTYYNVYRQKFSVVEKELDSPVYLGDADGDGEVSSIDVTLVQRYNAWMDTGVDDDVLMNADVDGNGELEIVDATWIQRYLAFMDVPYTIGEEK